MASEQPSLVVLLIILILAFLGVVLRFFARFLARVFILNYVLWLSVLSWHFLGEMAR